MSGLNNSPEMLKRKIIAGKDTVKEKYSVCKTASRRLIGAYEALLDAEDKRDLKDNAKNKPIKISMFIA